jgi:tRNA(fMet)-specific endonuclease VapC
MPLYMLATDTVRHLVLGKTPALDAQVATVSPKHLCISAVTRGEPPYGIKLKDGAGQLAQLVDQFLLRAQCLPWDEAAVTQFASIAGDLHKAGTRIGSMDAMIAGHAMATGAVLVTNSARHIPRVTGLTVENWSQEH